MQTQSVCLLICPWSPECRRLWLRLRLVSVAAALLILAATGYAAETADAQPAGDAVAFDRDIKPIFEASCYLCHGPEKQKAELRLDSPEGIQAGSEYGPVFVAGKPEESPLYTRVILPPDDADIMPAKGDPLTSEQTDLIRRWIAQGVSFTSAEAESIPAPPETATADSAIKEAPKVKVEEGPSILDQLAEGVPAPSEEALDALRALGAVAMPLDQKTPLVSVNLQYVGKHATDETLALLAPLAQQITWLNLAGTAVTDAGLAQLAQLPNLTSLHLERTDVGDPGVANLKSLIHLEYLNLYGTQVTDAGLDNLQTMEGLKKLYLWNSKATEAGAEKLKACLPELAVNLGVQLKVEPPSESESAMPTDLSFLFDADSCCAKAKAEGKDCDHPCCVEAAAKCEVCLKCNPGAEAKLALAKQFDPDSCCDEAFKAGKFCDHPCCVEAAAKGEVCLKCNPGAKDKVDTQNEPAPEEPEAPAPESLVPEPAAAPAKDANVAANVRTLEFNRHIRPILSNTCFTCHGPDKNARKANLRLDVRAAALEMRGDKTPIVPGDSTASELVRRITAADPDDVMPPADSEFELKPEQVEILITWIDEGAEYEPHWSYMAIKCPIPPKVANEDWVINPIDRFILAKLEAKGITPAPEADRTTLIRRVSFDLTGLPPKPDEVDAFVNDTDPHAYEQLVYRLLASPHYGERMAMRWLDLVRYADTNGYHGDEYRSVWPYRDYVINSFNENKPFDQFTIEQFAGDLLPNPAREQLIASGYNRMNQLTAEGGAQAAEYLAKYAADRIRTTSSVWLGTTMGCAECHDHKFDPFTTEDFYRFSAFFADIEEKGVYTAGEKWDPYLPLPSEKQSAEKSDLESAIAALEQTLATTTEELATALGTWEAETRAAIADSYNDWTALMPASLESSGGATLKVGEDLVIQSTGENPAKDDYTLVFRTNQQNITGIRLDALVDPKEGVLSRSNGNFVLTGFEVMNQCGDTCASIPIAKAVADYEQPEYPVSAAIDDDPESGWAVSGHEIKNVNRQAVFTFAEPIPGGPGTVLTIRMKHDSQFAQHNIARFRLALTTVPEPGLTTSSALGPDVFAALMVDEPLRSDEQRELLATYYRSVATELQETREELKAKKGRLAALIEEIPTTLITHAIEPRTIRILARGNFLDESGEVVEPDTPASLPLLGVSDRRATRLDLAKWLVSPDNPLTARVTVNRLWEQFFGIGISKVLDDFGSRGEWPTHPDLLDWLASEFINSGWDVKHMVRLMVTSSAYRQSSVCSPELRAEDPFNRLVARQSQIRLKAELIRDNALAVSGLLSEKIGGRSVYPYQPDGYWDNCNTFRGPLIYTTDEDDNQYRRGLYTFWKRSFLHPSLLAFDAPTREECTAERTVSNTPMQALVLLNDPTYVEAARVFAARILKEGGNTPESRIDWAYRQALSRIPGNAERAVLMNLCHEHMADYANDPDAIEKLLQTGLAPVPEDLDPCELAAWTSVARTILNLHETVTRS